MISKNRILILLVSIFTFKQTFADISYEFIHKTKESAEDVYETGYLDSSRRSIELKINGKNAGYVNYTITFDENHPCEINTLFVHKEFRGKYGCGKILLTHAINDILENGLNNIELSRSPFDLSPDDNFIQKDKKLEAWYGQFGFTNKYKQIGYSNSRMKLFDFDKFYKSNVYSIFTPDQVFFKKRDLTPVA